MNFKETIIKKVEDMSVEIHHKTLEMEKQEKMEDFILQIYQLKSIVELMRSHNEKIYRNNLPHKLEQRVLNARDYRIMLWQMYQAADEINKEVISNQKVVDEIKFIHDDVLSNLKE